MFELPTQPLDIVLDIANIHSIIVLLKQDDDDSELVISNDKREDLRESNL
jgi:hypothetical protein